jgi:hypothetical protein
MLLRFFQRGEPITSDKLNLLVNAIRANELAPGSGYTVSKTSCGTSINITSGTSSGGGGGGSSAPCPFSVSAASEGTTLRVQVQNTTVQTSTGARYPDGMSIDGPPFYLTISGTCFIYCKISYQPNSVNVVTTSDGITVLQSADALPNTVNDEYVLLATVVCDGDPLKIKTITNICLPVAANPCNLNWA